MMRSFGSYRFREYEQVYNIGRTFAPFYRLSGDKRVMVYRRRYYYNGRSFISVVYFGRLRTSFCRCASHKIIYFKQTHRASIMTTTRKSRLQLAVLLTFTNMKRRFASNYTSHFAINEYLLHS